MGRCAALLVSLVVLLCACSGDGGAGGERDRDGGRDGGRDTSQADSRSAALDLVDYRGSGRLALSGCASLAAPSGRPGSTILIGFRVRATEQVRLRRLVVSANTHGFDYLDRFVARDVDPAAPQVVAYDGGTPSRDRLVDDTRPVGDPRDSAAGLDAVRQAWQQRERVSGITLDRGEHYVFVRAELAEDPDLYGLSAVWSRGRGPEHLVTVGDLQLRYPRCGG